LSNADFGYLTVFLFLLLAAARLLGHLFAHFRQPKVVGEILAGLLLGPTVLGHFASGSLAQLLPGRGASAGASQSAVVLFFLYNFGLLLLMFVSGAETQGLFHREDRRQVAWLGALGTGIPFVATLIAIPFIPTASLAGTVHQKFPLMLVLAIAVAVTSIPVISKIFHDLRISHTRFARLVLGVAVIEDIVLWALLAIATALAESMGVPNRKIAVHVALTLAYFAVGLLLAPRFLAWSNHTRWNVLYKTSPIAYAVVLLLAYASLAALLDVSLVFAAFLAGYAVVADPELKLKAMPTISEFSFAVFIPIYFAVVGYKIDLHRSFSLSLLFVFLLVSSAVKVISAGIGARAAGFNFGDSLNLANALNARGGPGIVLASVAFDAGIISSTLYTTLVLVAILTSQAAGAWLTHVLRQGRPLLSSERTETRRSQRDILAAV
jgi:Kef-type K+ transport system membrane component KefB